MPRKIPDPNPDWQFQLRRLLDAHGTHYDVSDAIGVSAGTISKWENGTTPGPGRRAAIAKAYGRLGPGGRLRPIVERKARTNDLTEQALIVAHQALDGVREMDTIEQARAHANRCLVIVSELSARIQSVAA